MTSFGATVGASLLLTVSWIAIRARARDDPFEFQTGSWADDEVALAYTPFVHEAEMAKLEKDDRIKSKRLLKLAHEWDDAMSRGVLRPIKPTCFEDDCADGARGQILRSKSVIVSSLLQDAQRTARRHIGRATDEVLLAVRLSESQKYGDTSLIYSCANEERLELRFLRNHFADMSPSTRNRVKVHMDVLVGNQEKLTEVARTSDARFYAYQRRVRGKIYPGEIWQNAMIGRRITAEGKTPKTLRVVQSNYVNDQDYAALAYLLELKLATRNEQDCVADAQKVLARA